MTAGVNGFLTAVRQGGWGRIEDRVDACANVSRNVGDFQRDIQAVVQPLDRSSIVDIVAAARRFRVPLYPVSQGCNWGYGSKLPVQVGGVVLDLSELRSILQIDDDNGIAVIEPGVTQGQLSAELVRRGCRHVLDVTGSGAQTSVLGNALERGIAYRGLRVEQVTGLEVVLGNGRRFHTGFAGSPVPALAGLYPHGLGPSLDGLFFQSNMGIVLSGTVKLTRRPEALHILNLSFADTHLKEVVNVSRDLLRSGVIHGIPHISDRERTVSTLAPLVGPANDRSFVERNLPGDWTLTTAVAGPTAVARAKWSEARKALRTYGRLFRFSPFETGWRKALKDFALAAVATSAQKRLLEATGELRGLHLGRATDHGVRFLMGEGDTRVDDNPTGFLLCTPLAPLSGLNAEFFRDTVRSLPGTAGVRAAMTLNLITDRVLEAVISLHFARARAEQRSAAHADIKTLTRIFLSRGFYPYRVNIDQMDLVQDVNPRLHDTVLDIKKALDPDFVIAPDRYVRAAKPDTGDAPNRIQGPPQ